MPGMLTEQTQAHTAFKREQCTHAKIHAWTQEQGKLAHT